MNIQTNEEFKIPNKVKNLIGNRYAEYSKDNILTIFLIRNVSVKISDDDLLMTDEQFKDRILNPVIHNLERR